MTLPHERTRAVLRTADFLRDLLDPQKTPRVPLAVRQRASYLLKHYPIAHDLARVAPHDLGVFCEQTARGWWKERPRG